VVRQSSDVLSNLYDVDSKEHVLVVHDWLNQIIVSKYTKFLVDDGDEFVDAILINGRGLDVNTKRRKKRSDATVPMPRLILNTTCIQYLYLYLYTCSIIYISFK
jgi:hypothetical protein